MVLLENSATNILMNIDFLHIFEDKQKKKGPQTEADPWALLTSLNIAMCFPSCDVDGFSSDFHIIGKIIIFP